MASDSLLVLGRLVQSGIWSRPGSLSGHSRLVVDVESVLDSLCRACIGGGHPHAGTLINFVRFGHLTGQLLDHLAHLNIEPLLVYEGKRMEAPIYGLPAAEFTKNSQLVVETIKARLLEEKQQQPRFFKRPNLALILFKKVVNVRRRTGFRISTYQAFYSAHPLMAKLARDHRCPVLTNQADFIIMDVRAGFVLFDEFWSQQVLGASSSRKSSPNVRQPPRSKSRSPSASVSDSKIKSPQRSNDQSLRFHQSLLFLHQHPGLNAPLAMNLFPLTSPDFLVKYSKSLKNMRVFDREYNAKDFVLLENSQKTSQKVAYKRHHLAANRLEMALSFLAGKTHRIVGNLVRSQATHSGTSFDTDFRQLFNYRAVAHEFKFRLRATLKYLHDPIALNCLEARLVLGECTADYLLPLLSCSVGRLASIAYNHFLQQEDLQTKHSAYSLMNRHKSMLMSLFSANRSRQSERSTSSASSAQDSNTRYRAAHLTVVDREGPEVVERELTTTMRDEELDALRGKLALNEWARREVNKRDASRFIALAFNSKDLLQMDERLLVVANKFLDGDEHHLRNELAIVRHLFAWAVQEASAGDDYFKAAYLKLTHHLELALLNHYLYTSQALLKLKHPELASLVDMISRNQAELKPIVANESASKRPQSAGATKSPKQKSNNSEKTAKDTDARGKQLRHLIELLNSSLEAYCELNAFFDYPLPKLNLHLHYNPILIYNLALYSSSQHQNSKAMIKF